MSIMTLVKDFILDQTRAPSERELADLGLSHSDYRRLMTSQDGTRLRMEDMAARFDVTPEMIDADLGLALELAQTCGHCRNAKACQNAMDLGIDFETTRCPNASVYSDMSPV